ncbi:elongation of very long chain fatty acids protein 7-like [Glossina fuscipes]|uniref:Elongation of very long chain fatty acids protein n=1 Tax=Glossina fuscipes TaxID=7396 RepID=A0A8U0WIC5_9MUSC|nr:elongation of very long chain fatty acids protein 7-like [Glossina fuscipes]KAI9584426.1 hypothetical protein GQX74_006321 [Glossina fuscipes]
MEKMENSLTNLVTIIYKSRDSRLDEWPLMSSPAPISILLFTYLTFILFIGPLLMENRKAFALRRILQVYNIIQIFFNIFMIVSLTYRKVYIIGNLFSSSCKVERTNDEILYLSECAWYYMINKILDLLDTIFIVLRKKQSQVTFLHVYHHTIMVVSAWSLLKYADLSEEFGFGYVLNNGIHILMYFYYLVAAMGPQYQRYLWWKKYITKMQMGQFALVLLYMAIIAMKGCGVSLAMKMGIILNASVFLLLFTNFYRKAYTKKDDSTEKSNKLN